MGIVDLIAAIGKVATENDPALDFAAVDPTLEPYLRNGQSAGGTFVRDVVRSSQGRTTSMEASRMGLPEAEGLSREQIQQLLELREMPLRQEKIQQDIASSKALESDRTTRAKTRQRLDSLREDPDYPLAFKAAQKEIEDNPILGLRIQNEPEEELRLVQRKLDVLKAARSGKQTLPERKPVEKKAGAESVGKPDLSKAIKNERGKVLVERDGRKGYVSPDKIKDTDKLVTK
jgi:hypothetical protein